MIIKFSKLIMKDTIIRRIEKKHTHQIFVLSADLALC